jgi:hypothetical protein
MGSFKKGDDIARIGHVGVFNVVGVRQKWYEVLDMTRGPAYQLPDCLPIEFVEREFVLIDTFEERRKGDVDEEPE